MRIALVPVLLIRLDAGDFMGALIIFLVAGVSDALDGYIAKKYNAVSKLGAILDPLADKALLVSAYIMLFIVDSIPYWLMVAVVFRDVVIVAGYLIMTLYFESITMKPLLISKINTVAQIVFVVLILFLLSSSWQMQALVMSFQWLVFSTSVLSGLAYVYIWSVKAMKNTV